MQKAGKVRLPKGKKVACSVGMDFDAQCIWDGSFNLTSPAYMSRGEFGAEVAAPRILDFYKEVGIKATWFIPGHTAATFPDICKRVVDEGHEVGHHGYYHENPTNFNYAETRELYEMAIYELEKIGAPKPVSYRSPYWDFGPDTMKVVHDLGMKYDSSLMGNDFHPYLVRPVEVHSRKANVFGEPSPVIEIPVSWFLDDWPQTEYLTGGQEGQRPAGDIFDRWKAWFDFACTQEGACYILTCHPQTTGRAHMFMMYKKLIQYMEENGAWFATIGEIGDATYFED